MAKIFDREMTGPGGGAGYGRIARLSHAQWNTPKTLYDKLNQEFHFDFDPCPEGGMFGLEKPWGERNFINPPYGPPILKWLEKGIQEWLLGKTCVFLLPARTDTKWFHELVLPMTDDIRFIRGRLKFIRYDGHIGRCPFASMIVVFRAIDFGPGPSRKEEG